MIYDRQGRFSPLKALSLTLLLAPALWLAWRAASHDLGPLAFTEAIHFSGKWAVRFLLVTLALTPLQRIFRWNRVAIVRRMFGVGTACWAGLHFALYVASVKADLVFVTSEILHRVYLTIGFAALAGLAVLAATSTDTMIRRLGTWWKRLHRLAYPIAALAILHFFMQSKIDASEATLMAGLLITLMLYRLLLRLRWPVNGASLSAAALAGGALTAATEFAWYGLATGINPWRVLGANLHVMSGVRPAVIVVLAGLAVTLAQSAWRLLKSPPPGRPEPSAA